MPPARQIARKGSPSATRSQITSATSCENTLTPECFDFGRFYPDNIPVRDKRVPLPVFPELVVLQLTEADDVPGLQRAIALAVVEVHLLVAPGFRVALAWPNRNHSAPIEALHRPVFSAPVVGLDGNDESGDGRRDGFVELNDNAVLQGAHHFFGSGLRYLSRRRLGSRSASFTIQLFLRCKDR